MIGVWSVFSSVFPGPQMPWNENSSLQVPDMYDQVYSHLIGPSNHIALQILGQVIIAQGMGPDMDIAGRPTSSSPKLIAAILGLEHSSVMRAVAELHSVLEVGNEDEDIRFQNPSFVKLLLDQTRSQKWSVDIDAAWLLLQNAYAIIMRIFNTEGMWICQLVFLFYSLPASLRCLFSKVFAFLPSPKDLVLQSVAVALAQCRAAGLTSSLPEMLPTIIFGKYESLVQSAPWDRHPYTVSLKQICATIRVRKFFAFDHLDQANIHPGEWLQWFR